MSSENTTAATSSRWRRVLQITFVCLALGLLVYLLDRVGWSQIGHYLTQLGWLGVVAIFVLGTVENVLDAVALQAAIPKSVPLIRVLAYNQAGGLLNRVIPWEAGEILKGSLLRREVSTTFAVAGTVVWNYLFRLSKPIAAFAVAVVGWLLVPAAMKTVAAWTVFAALCSFLPYFGFRILVRVGLANLLVSLLKFARILRRDPDAAISRAREIDGTIREYWKTHPGRYVQVLVYQIGARLASWITLYVALLFIEPSYGLAISATVWAALTVASYLVALTPTRLGTTEATSFGIFELLGLDGGVGLTSQCVLTVKAIILDGLTPLLGAGRTSPALESQGESHLS